MTITQKKTKYSPVGKVKLELDTLRWYVQSRIKDFETLPGFEMEETRLGRHFFKDNGANVLAVAHLDTVLQSNHFRVGRGIPTRGTGKKLTHKKIKKKLKSLLNTEKSHEPLVVYSAKLDDRLGAYIICDLLPKLGIVTDILLTEGEETCSSTARDFEGVGRSYNWIFSFDREGKDVVMYEYENEESTEQLEKHGMEVSFGSYSDISELTWLGCVGFNFGAGNYLSHFIDAFMVVSHCYSQVRKFRSFYSEFRDTMMEYDEHDYDKFPHSYGSYYSRSYRDGNYSTWAYDIEDKGKKSSIVRYTRDTCPWCGGNELDPYNELTGDLICAWCSCVVEYEGTQSTAAYSVIEVCPSCKLATALEDLIEVQYYGKHDVVCVDCYEAFYIYCERCDDPVHYREAIDMIWGNGTMRVCSRCRETILMLQREAYTCEVCGLREQGEKIPVDGMTLCYSCYTSYLNI